MSHSTNEDGHGTNFLRERLPQEPAKPQQAESEESAKHVVSNLNDQESKSGKEEKRTYGRTPNGVGMFPFYLQELRMVF